VRTGVKHRKVEGEKHVFVLCKYRNLRRKPSDADALCGCCNKKRPWDTAD
jgi:hypothetical protein